MGIGTALPCRHGHCPVQLFGPTMTTRLVPFQATPAGLDQGLASSPSGSLDGCNPTAAAAERSPCSCCWACFPLAAPWLLAANASCPTSEECTWLASCLPSWLSGWLAGWSCLHRMQSLQAKWRSELVHSLLGAGTTTPTLLRGLPSGSQQRPCFTCKPVPACGRAQQKTGGAL